MPFSSGVRPLFFALVLLTFLALPVFEIPQLVESPVVKRFFQEERHKYLQSVSRKVSQEVHYATDEMVTVPMSTSDQYNRVFMAAAHTVGVPKKFLHNFALFLDRDGVGARP